MSIFYHRTAAGRASMRHGVSLIEQAFSEGRTSGAIMMDAKGHTVVPEDFFDRLQAQLNPPGQSLGLDALCDRLVAEAKAEDEAFVAAITTHPEADLRKAAANLGTNDHCVSMRLAAEAELRRREA